MTFLKLTDRRGCISIIKSDAIVEITPYESGSLLKMDCRAIGHQNNQSVVIESPDTILAMIDGGDVFTVERQYMLALHQICMLADTESDLHKQTFDPNGEGKYVPGWIVAKKMLAIASDVLGSDRP